MMELLQMVDDDLLRTAFIIAAPMMVAALGELLLERVGLLNLAIEGMVAVGASVAFVVAYFVGTGSALGPITAVLAAGLCATCVGLIYGWLTLTMRAHQVTVGLALLIFGLGAASLIYRAAIGITTSPPSIGVLPIWRVPLLSEVPYFGRILFQHDLFVYAGLGVVLPVWWVLYKTPLGLRLRACGESPRAVDSLGIPLLKLRYAAVAVGSAMIGVAGAFFPLSVLGGYSNNIAAGRGWLALMLVIFARWRPWPVVAGALLFAWVEALQFQFGVTNKAIPPQFLQMLPYILAIVVLVKVYGTTQAPAALTKTYSREARS